MSFGHLNVMRVEVMQLLDESFRILNSDDVKRLFGADNAWDVIEEVLVRHFRERLVTSPRQRIALRRAAAQLRLPPARPRTRAVRAAMRVAQQQFRRAARFPPRTSSAPHEHNFPSDPRDRVERAPGVLKRESEIAVIASRQFIQMMQRHLTSPSAPGNAIVRLPNVYTDTSGVKRFDYVVEAVKRGGAHKVLFGSDGPWLHPALELQKIRLLGLPVQQEALILGGNLQRLLSSDRS